MSDTILEYRPVPSLAPLFTDVTPYHKYIFVLGPIGSNKTLAVIYFLLTAAAKQAPDRDGIRRTRFAVIRNTFSQLKMTVLRDIQEHLGPIAKYVSSENVIIFDLPGIHSEWHLMPLETPEDQRKLLSMQLTGAWVAEGREVKFELIMAAYSRTGRYPSMAGPGCTHRFVISESNLGVIHSPLYNFLEVERPPNCFYIHQPSAMSPLADWKHHLPENYYEDMMVGTTKQWQKQHIYSEWGADLSGEPVFQSAWDSDRHVSKRGLKVLPDWPLVVGIDNNLNPAAVIAQLSPTGQLRVLQEVYAANVLFHPFVTELLMPVLRSPRYQLCPLTCVLDPSGVSRDANATNTAYGILEEAGLEVAVASTNDIEPRIRSVERYLVENRQDQPAILVDPRCQVLIRGFEGAYAYKRSKLTDQLDPKPAKLHPVSDVHDALQYACLGLSGKRMRRRAGLIPAYAPSIAIPSAGWT